MSVGTGNINAVVNGASGGGTGRVELMDVIADAGVIGIASGFVSDTPYDDGGMIPIPADPVFHVFFPMFGKPAGRIVAGNLPTFPFGEFVQNHHAHFIAELIEGRRAGVVGGADTVDAHILHDLDLIADDIIRLGDTHGPQGPVIGNTLQFNVFPVQVKAVYVIGYDPESKLGDIIVQNGRSGKDFGFKIIKIRSFRIPKQRMIHLGRLIDGCIPAGSNDNGVGGDLRYLRMIGFPACLRC